MKDVATRLEVGTMSLYYYVDDKTTLLVQMVGRLYADVEVPSAARPWRERVEAIAHQLYRGHQSVPGLDPHLFILAEAPLASVLTVANATNRAMLDAGLHERAATMAARAVLGYAADRGASTAKRLALRRANPTLPKLQSVDGTVEAGEGPSYAALVGDYDDVFAFGLGCLLDGIDQQIPLPPA